MTQNQKHAHAALSAADQELLDHIRERVSRCRRLALSINDKRAIEALLEMAREGEEDIQRLEQRAGG